MDGLNFDNPYYKRVEGSRLLLIRCGHCKASIAKYQKVGKGGVLRLYIDRIIKSSIDLSQLPEALFCPNCNAHLATKLALRKKNKDVYVMVRSAFNTSVLDG